MTVMRLVIRLVSVAQEKGEDGESERREEGIPRHASRSLWLCGIPGNNKTHAPLAVRERRHTHSGLLDMLSATVSPAPMPSSEERKSAMSVDTISISA